MHLCPPQTRCLAGKPCWHEGLLSPSFHFPEQICALECARGKEGQTQKGTLWDSFSKIPPGDGGGGVCRGELGRTVWLMKRHSLLALQRPHFHQPVTSDGREGALTVPLILQMSKWKQIWKGICLRSRSMWVAEQAGNPNTFMRQSGKFER